MKKDLTSLVVVLDRSGSMTSLEGATISGVNEFLAQHKLAEGEATLTLLQFDHELTYSSIAKSIKEIEPLTKDTYIPRGSTALFDAIGRAVDDEGTRLAALPENLRPSKVVVMIMTDGLENASRTETMGTVKARIEHQQEKYGWEFVFMGANQDAVLTATTLGFDGKKAATYGANAKNARDILRFAAQNTVAYRSNGATGQSLSFSDEQLTTAVDQGL